MCQHHHQSPSEMYSNQKKAASLLQRVFRRRLVRNTLLRTKKSAASLALISKTCCKCLGVPFFGGQKRMFTTLTSKIKSGSLLRRRYKAIGRQLFVSFGASAEAALNYEMALVACSDEHRRACSGRNAVQLAIENIRLEAAAKTTTPAEAAAAATAKHHLHRIFAGCCPHTSSGWDVVHYGLRHGATGAAAIVIYDLAEVVAAVASAAVVSNLREFHFNHRRCKWLMCTMMQDIIQTSLRGCCSIGPLRLSSIFAERWGLRRRRKRKSSTC